MEKTKKPSKSKPSKPVIYTSPGCTWCHKEKEWLKENKIAFTEKDVTNQTNAKKMVELSGQTGTPVTVIGKEVIVGFDKPKLKKALGK